MRNKNNFEQLIRAFYKAADNIPYNYKQVSSAIGAESPRERSQVVEILETLALSGELKETTPGKFKAAGRASVYIATFERRSKGFNHVILNDGTRVDVAERSSLHALDGDIVKVHLSASRIGAESTAEVLEIIERKEHVIVGTLQVHANFAMLVVDSKYLSTDVFLPIESVGEGKSGDKAVVRIVDWPAHANSPIGEVVDILGATGENDAEIHAILAEYGLPYQYPKEVERAANRLSAEISAEEIARRRDMRNVTTFTIDPRDAKDFDDALSIQKLSNGLWEIGIHIADVSHFVKPGTVIDREARERATSVYLVDRTIPMLPERLCNFICSLRPDEEKLAHSCIVTMNDNAEVLNCEICHTVIKSNRRFTYEEAQEIITSKKGDFSEEIGILNTLAQKLRKARFNNGALDFNRVEVHFNIDEDGHPTGVTFNESNESHQLVEEFMLLANRRVAEKIGKIGKNRTAKAFVYRVHDEPDPERISNLAGLARQFGYKFKISGNSEEINASINRMLRDCAGKPEENLLSIVAIRSMAKAIYTTENIGHYGLGFEFYTHFTSPIRRYPDIMVHRLLDRYANARSRSVDVAALEEDCKHSSDMEKLASDAERSSIKYKQVEYLGDHLGEVFEGTISGVTEWGIYVELNENKCEGLVPMRSLDDDFYEFDEKNFCLIGRRFNNRYQLGDPVTIQIARADMVKKLLDFVIVDENHPAFTHAIDKQPIKFTPEGLYRLSEKMSGGKKGSGKKGGKAKHNKGTKKSGKDSKNSKKKASKTGKGKGSAKKVSKHHRH